jgi:hypothetical protein
MNALVGSGTAIINLTLLTGGGNLATGDIVFQTISANNTAAASGAEMYLIDVGTYESDADFLAAKADYTITTTTIGDNDGFLMAYKTGSGDVNIGIAQTTGSTNSDDIDAFTTILTLVDFNDYSLLSAGDITVVT